MISIEFTESERQALHYERFHHPHPRVQRKMEAVWLKSHQLPHRKIAEVVGISENTLRRYLRDYQCGGISALKQVNFYRPQSELMSHVQTIDAYFREHPPATIPEAIATIENLTGLKRQPTQVRKFLKSMGMRCLKVGFVPGKADPEIQSKYKQEKLSPRLEEAKVGKRAVFFVDAAHFVMGAFLGFLW